MTEREFSRRLNIEIIKDEPKDFPTYVRDTMGHTPINADGIDALAEDYKKYLERFQPYRFRAVAANNEPIAHGESYHNEADAINAANLLAGDDTTVYVMPMYGDDRSEKVLRFGATDRKQLPPF